MGYLRNRQQIDDPSNLARFVAGYTYRLSMEKFY